MASVGSRAAGKLSLGQRLFSAFQDWYIYAAGYRQIGLRREDLLSDDDPDVVEALKRIPDDELNMRNFRVKRAIDATMKQRLLPQELWTKPSEDVTYLDIVIEQVKKERMERELFDKQ
ncbi:cytochrome b-c1 complex subunit 7 [Exaiptasia diaphana]|uniref:Cytochrome b-c1 complex subunit 7 n=1 Tax=Exaiptasia diaphana TaxID=2652724 RepID=A0A913X8W7_EXADI|nr:cytochrome b-c1 complex subunit 7 [Exaiptasia diaphana]KXJ14074.1 Cytochrome b-c1 complex subunit 7 [Exaiptasia diaphana]